MPDFSILEPTDNNSFQIQWESTLKCNLDCTYCGDGHDNSTEHPSLEDSLKTVDFIFEYTDIQMQRKTDPYRLANLNVQGGESMFHPNILEILEYIDKKKQEYDWYMGVATITNAVVGARHWKEISKYITYYTISYHSESLKKQQDMVRKNILYLKEQGKNFHVAILMHPHRWENCVNMVEWCKENEIKYHARQLDHGPKDTRFLYTPEQIEYLTGKKIVEPKVETDKPVDLSSRGRACCGGNTLCINKTTNTKYVVGNTFSGWTCSVDKFFLYIKQVGGAIYTGKDCKMNFDGSVGPIGNLSNTKELLDRVRAGTDDIVCKKRICWCGLCAPKAETKELYDSIIHKYEKRDLT